MNKEETQRMIDLVLDDIDYAQQRIIEEDRKGNTSSVYKEFLRKSNKELEELTGGEEL
jgi:adenine-specific DNA methylase